MKLNTITLGKRGSDNIKPMIIISDCLLIQRTYLLFIWELVNLGQYDHIKRMITLSVIILNSSHNYFNYNKLHFSKSKFDNKLLLLIMHWKPLTVITLGAR
jgi:hypothetical protein